MPRFASPIVLAALLALGCNKTSYRDAHGVEIDVAADYAALGTAPVAARIATQGAARSASPRRTPS